MNIEELKKYLKNHSTIYAKKAKLHEYLVNERDNLIDTYYPQGMDYSAPRVTNSENFQEQKMACIVDRICAIDDEIDRLLKAIERYDEIDDYIFDMSSISGTILMMLYYSNPKRTFSEVAEELEISDSYTYKLCRAGLNEVCDHFNKEDKNEKHSPN